LNKCAIPGKSEFRTDAVEILRSGSLARHGQLTPKSRASLRRKRGSSRA
jgi:hypothetical protein